DDRRVIDTKEEAIARPVPLRISFDFREPQDLERVAVRVLKVERSDPARVHVPIWEALWRRRRVLDTMLSKARVCTIDVTHNDRDVLKPAIVTPGVDRNRPSTRCEVFLQLDGFPAESQPHDTHTKPEDPLEALIGLAQYLDVGDLFEPQDV